MTKEHMNLTVKISADYAGAKLFELEDSTMLLEVPREQTVVLSAPYLQEAKNVDIQKLVQAVIVNVVDAHTKAVNNLNSVLFSEKHEREKEEREKDKSNKLGLIWPDEKQEGEEE